ncbi:MAG: methylated-DNA--[protein]-cysteine S-methyltransferase [Clostridia bacterium]|nr:methylated-DNA--[protein]-cysteine S-methyltransferase [Clostridia bacterium]
MVNYISKYASPLGGILIAADDEGLTGLWFEGAKYFALGLGDVREERESEAIKEAKRWLDIYFSGSEPSSTPPLHPTGTPFQLEVWDILRSIPYGTTVSYGYVANVLAQRRGVLRTSAQAVGGAVGHNKISLIIPCHRVVGADGSLTGYAGGLDKKIELLKSEGVDMSEFSRGGY